MPIEYRKHQKVPLCLLPIQVLQRIFSGFIAGTVSVPPVASDRFRPCSAPAADLESRFPGWSALSSVSHSPAPFPPSARLPHRRRQAAGAVLPVVFQGPDHMHRYLRHIYRRQVLDDHLQDSATIGHRYAFIRYLLYRRVGISRRGADGIHHRLHGFLKYRLRLLAVLRGHGFRFIHFIRCNQLHAFLRLCQPVSPTH